MGYSFALLSQTTIYLIAVGCSVAASFCTSLGLIMMKMANIKVEKAKNSNQWTCCQIEWLFGLFLLCFTNIFNLLALYLGSILLIASTACVTIIFNAVLSPLLLKEKFKCFPDGLTVILLSLGSTLAAVQ